MSREYDFKGFDRIRISGAFDVEIKRSESFQVSISADALKPIKVDKEGDTLIIGLPWDYYFWGFLTAWMRARIVISMPELRELRIAGAARGESDNYTTSHDFGMDISGASQFTLGGIECGVARVRIVGASRVECRQLKATRLDLDIVGASRASGDLDIADEAHIKMVGASQAEFGGRAGSLKTEIAGASRATLSALSVQNAGVKLVGASRAVVNVSGKLDVDLTGASDLSWIGNPVMGNVKSVGASQLHRA
jgi:hypothetical protein